MTFDLRPSPGATRPRKRKGAGIGSGHGKTCGRGMKGQKARDQVHPRFEGGQNPLYKRVPQLRGQSAGAMNIGMFRRHIAEVNVGRLEVFPEGSEVTPQALLERRIVRKLGDGVKILGNGDLTRRLTVRAHAFSASARKKIEQAGGEAVEI